MQIPYDPMSVYMCLCVYLYLYQYSYLCLVSSKALGFEEPEYVLVSVYCYCTTPTTTSRSTTAAITTTTAVTILREARQSGRRDDTGGIGGSSVRWSGGPVTPRVDGVSVRRRSDHCDIQAFAVAFGCNAVDFCMQGGMHSAAAGAGAD